MKALFAIFLFFAVAFQIEAAKRLPPKPWKPSPVAHPTNPPVIVTNAPIVIPPIQQTNPPVEAKPVGTATLTWTASADNTVTGYKIYAGKSSGSYTSMTLAGNVTSASFENLDNHTQYFFAVTATDGKGNESPFSNEATLTTP